jgi:hypothetical protein
MRKKVKRAYKQELLFLLSANDLDLIPDLHLYKAFSTFDSIFQGTLTEGEGSVQLSSLLR